MYHGTGLEGRLQRSPTLLEEISQSAAFGQRALIIAVGPNPILSGQRRSLAKATSEIMLTGTRLLLAPPSGPPPSR